MRRRIFILYSLITLQIFSFAGFAFQSELEKFSDIPHAKGTPRIIHYSRQDFNADPQIWSMTQDDQGLMYFGNNDGVLVFDGARWHKVALPNNSSVRSLQFSSDGKVYAGGFNEFGLIEKDEYGNYMYVSYMDKLRPEDRNLENIWKIHEVQGHIVFRSFSKLIALSDGKATTIPTTSFYYSAVVNDQLFLVDGEGIKLLDLESLEFTMLVPTHQLGNESIVSILPGITEGELLIHSKQGSSYRYNLDTHKFWHYQQLFDQSSNNQILSAIQSASGNYYMGTLSSQIIVLDRSGMKIPVESPFLDLQDNTVLNLYESAEGNIWALLNNGIDCINISSPVSVLFEDASVFDVSVHGGKLYAATNQGVFVSEKLVQSPSFSSLKFDKVAGLEGQAWTLYNFQDKVICSHDRGLFLISEDGVEQLKGLHGAWKILPIQGEKHKFLACTYYGIYLLEFTADKGFQLRHRIEGFDESSRDIIQGDEPGVFWVCHGYKGVYRIKLDRSFENVVSLEHFRENGLPSPYSINVYRWNDQVIFTTNNGLYTYESESGTFAPHKKLNQLFGTDLNVRKILQRGSKTWFIHDDEAGYFEKEDFILRKGLFLELKSTFNRGMECIFPINEDHVLLGTNTGLYAYDLSFRPQSGDYGTLITEVSYHQNKSLIEAAIHSGSATKLPDDISGIQFKFSAPKLKDQTQVQYSYLLKGIDENWSEWDDTPYKEYTSLPSGSYTFLVKSRNMLGEQAPPASFSFEVLPAWYLTKIAGAIYLLCLIGLLYSSRKLMMRRISKEKEKTRIEEKEKRSLLELELQQIRLAREKEKIERDKEQLEEDVIHKSKELANYTMLLAKKRELLTDLREELKDYKDLARNEKARNLVRQLIRKIGIHLNDEEHIHVFEANFERVHHEFLSELKAQYPDLTAKELRLCALIKMNLTNKEIAPILNISIRGVETARYRLRKRMDINDNMVEFLEKISPTVKSEE